MKPINTDSPVVINTVDMHTGGMTVRIVESGYPPIIGKTILDKMHYLETNLDNLRSFLMLEPRGHHDQFGVILVEPDDPNADIGAIFIHNKGYGTMCGHATIALGRYVVDRKLNRCAPVTRDGKLYVDTNIQCPCGLVNVSVEIVDGKSASVSFVNVPAFLVQKDVTLQTKEHGPITVDVSYGGNFYILVSGKKLKVDVETSTFQEIVSGGMAACVAGRDQLKLEHPDSKDLAFLFGAIVTDGNDDWSSDEVISSVCVFAENQADRSPCGSGVSARIASQYAKGKIGLGQPRVFGNGKTGSTFTAMVKEETTCGPFPAVRVQVTGHAYHVGQSSFTYEEGDKMKFGFSIK